ncbi:MAG TPA: Holliday junction resolvase RuvX [Hansschlegelia sp.]
MTSAFDDFATFCAALPPVGSIAGLDLGTKTLGVAVSDPGRTVASPLETIARTRFTADVDRLLWLSESRRCAGFVLGLPVNMDGSEGPRAQATRAFARNLTRRTDLPIGFWDERLSTAAVERLMISFDTSRKKRAEQVDRLAAAYILQGALDRLSTIRRNLAAPPLG